MIAVENLCKSYGTLKAVDSVSFTIRQGECFGLLGPNGAGKSTTIGMLAGAIRCDSGRISIDGADDPRKPEARRKLGIAPQGLAVYPELSAVENLSFFASLYGLSKEVTRRRVEWAIALAGLEERSRDLVKRFSGGMKRRLNLACALVHDPKVVFLDEPTAGVDPQSRNHIFDTIETLESEGLTVLYTTHYMEEAQRLCDRVGIMDRGRLLAIDTVPALVSAHGGKTRIEIDVEEEPEDPSVLPGELDGKTLHIETDKPFETIRSLSGHQVDLSTIHVRSPNLENVFLALTGRSLRD